MIGRPREAGSVSCLVLHVADKQEVRGWEEHVGGICGGSVYFCMLNLYVCACVGALFCVPISVCVSS